jgi:phosphoribosylformylglycinamidine (FGAM) synthase PurS component
VTQRTYAVELTIPDNTAFTALVTLQRLGIPCDEVHRTDIYAFEVDDDRVAELDANIRQIETLFNPNKHVLRIGDKNPEAGEVWIAEREEAIEEGAEGLEDNDLWDHDGDGEGDEGETARAEAQSGLRLAGRELAGVHSLRHMTAWRLRKDGRDVSEKVLAAAVEGLLCNPAFQKAIR